MQGNGDQMNHEEKEDAHSVDHLGGHEGSGVDFECGDVDDEVLLGYPCPPLMYYGKGV